MSGPSSRCSEVFRRLHKLELGATAHQMSQHRGVSCPDKDHEQAHLRLHEVDAALLSRTGFAGGPRVRKVGVMNKILSDPAGNRTEFEKPNCA